MQCYKPHGLLELGAERFAERASGSGRIAVAGAKVASTPSVSRAVFLSHTSRCCVEFSSAHGGGRGRKICSSGRCSARVGVGEGAGARGLQSGVVAMYSSARVGVGKGAEACSISALGGLGRHLGSSVAFGSGCG